MSLELLLPVDDEVLVGQTMLPKQILGKNIIIHTKASGLPELIGLKIIIPSTANPIVIIRAEE